MPCITEQFLILYWGKGKDGEAVKELGIREEVCIFFLFKILLDSEYWTRKA